MTDLAGPELGEKAKAEIALAFLSVVREIVQHNGWNKELVTISETSLALALAESAKDLLAIRMRRDHPEISVGKLAGIVTFRLARWNPIHLSGELAENPAALKLNALTAFVLGIKHFLGANVTEFPPNVTQEFHYTLLRRHTNQETLGLAYDMLDHHVTFCKRRGD